LTSAPSKYTFMDLVASSTTAIRCGPVVNVALTLGLPIIPLPKSLPNKRMSTVTIVSASQNVSGRIRTFWSEYQRKATSWPEETLIFTACSIAALSATGSLKLISMGCPEPMMEPSLWNTTALASLGVDTVVNDCVFRDSRFGLHYRAQPRRHGGYTNSSGRNAGTNPDDSENFPGLAFPLTRQSNSTSPGRRPVPKSDPSILAGTRVLSGPCCRRRAIVWRTAPRGYSSRQNRRRSWRSRPRC
jgi:hypothetical protein